MKKIIIFRLFLSILFSTTLILIAQDVIFEINNQHVADNNGYIPIILKCQFLIIDKPVQFIQNTQYGIKYSEQSINNAFLFENNQRILQKRYHNEIHKIGLQQHIVQWERLDTNQNQLSFVIYNYIANNNPNNNFQQIQAINQNTTYRTFVLRVSNDRLINLNASCQVFVNTATNIINDGYSSYDLSKNTTLNDKTNGMYQIATTSGIIGPKIILTNNPINLDLGLDIAQQPSSNNYRYIIGIFVFSSIALNIFLVKKLMSKKHKQ